jgi:hypothetical protein
MPLTPSRVNAPDGNLGRAAGRVQKCRVRFSRTRRAAFSVSTIPRSAGQGFRLPLFQGILPVDRSGSDGTSLPASRSRRSSIPGTMGYTKIIGTPVITGLYTILIPMSLFAIFGSSRHLSVNA